MTTKSEYDEAHKKTEGDQVNKTGAKDQASKAKGYDKDIGVNRDQLPDKDTHTPTVTTGGENQVAIDQGADRESGARNTDSEK